MEKRDLDIITNSTVDWRMYQDKTVLITGATGRIGRYILETLVDMDIRYNLNIRIIGLARDEKKIKDVFYDIEEFPNVQFLNQDINTIINYKYDIDYIFHTAGPAAPENFRDNPVETLWTHINGTHGVLECAITHHTKRIFYVSTVETYGEWNEERKIKESDMGILRHLNSRACYPEAKRVCETMFECYKKQYGISYCGVRLCHTLGPGISLTDGRAFAEFISCVLHNKNIILNSDGGTMRTYTYTADAVNAIFLIMEKGSDIFYNVAADENLISIRDLAQMISLMILGHEVKVLFSKEAKNMPYLPFKLAIMNTELIRNLGWKPSVNIETTFRWTIESFL